MCVEEDTHTHTQALKSAVVTQTEEEGSLKSSCSLVF